MDIIDTRTSDDTFGLPTTPTSGKFIPPALLRSMSSDHAGFLRKEEEKEDATKSNKNFKKLRNNIAGTTMLSASAKSVSKKSLYTCLHSVFELNIAGIIFRVMSKQVSESDGNVEYWDMVFVIVLNLGYYNVKQNNSPLRNLLKKFGWLKRGEFDYRNPLKVGNFDGDGFRNALGLMYMSMKNVVTLDNSPLNLALSFCPNLLLKHIKNQYAVSTDCRVSKMAFFGTCMLADISGFTVMSSTYSNKGSQGLNELHRIANDFLGKLVEIVYSYGGDVIAFAGDAIICVFEDAYYSTRKSEFSGVKALLCAQEITIHVPEIFKLSAFALTNHVALSYGEMTFGVLGGVENNFVFLLNGKCVSELECLSDAGKGEIVITPEMYEKINLTVQVSGNSGQQQFITHKCPSGNYLVDKFEGKVAMVSPDQRLEAVLSTLKGEQISKYVSMFIPPPALDAIRHDSFFMLSSIKQVTTLFLDLTTYNAEKHRDPVSLQPFFEVVQRALAETKGFLRQFLIDDKGCVVIAMWGVPAFDHKDNAARALTAAFLISTNCNAINHRCSIGISTGDVYCGNIGASFRRDYVAIGSAVNTSARIMCKAKEKIFLDSLTFEGLPEEARHQLVKYGELNLKGISVPVVAYTYASAIKPQLTLKNVHDFGIFATMRNVLEEELLHELSSEQRQGMKFTLAELAEGSYRSSLADYFSEHAKFIPHFYRIQLKLRDQHSRYGVICNIIQQILDEYNVVGESSQRLFLYNVLSGSMRPNSSVNNILNRVEQLKNLLNLRWVDISTSIGGYQRYNHMASENASIPVSILLLEDDWLIDVVKYIFKVVLKQESAIIVMEEAHLCDDLSMILLSQLQESDLSLMFFLTVCPEKISNKDSRNDRSNNYLKTLFHDTLDLDEFPYTKIASHACCKVITTPLLTAEDTSSLVAKEPAFATYLEKSDCFAERIFDITGGHPFWSYLVMSYLLEFGKEGFSDLYLESMAVKVTKGDMHAFAPFVKARLYKLNYNQQMVIRIASVCGDEFNADDLAAMLPNQFIPSVRDALDVFIKHSLLSRSQEFPLQYSFVNSYVRKAIYQTITPAEAAKAHLRLGQYLAKKMDEMDTSSYSSISKHYTKSLVSHPEQRTETFKLRIKAANAALRSGGFYDAINHCAVTWANVVQCQAEMEYVKIITIFSLEQLRLVKKNYLRSKEESRYLSDADVLLKEDVQKYERLMRGINAMNTKIDAAEILQIIPKQTGFLDYKGKAKEEEVDRAMQDRVLFVLFFVASLLPFLLFYIVKSAFD